MKGYPLLSPGIPSRASRRQQQAIERALRERDAELAALTEQVRRLEVQAELGRRRDDEFEFWRHETVWMLRTALKELGVPVTTPESLTQPMLRLHRGGRAS